LILVLARALLQDIRRECAAVHAVLVICDLLFGCNPSNFLCERGWHNGSQDNETHRNLFLWLQFVLTRYISAVVPEGFRGPLKGDINE